MSQVTVRQLAEVVGVPVDRLIEQLGHAGMSFEDPDAPVSNKDKMRLLEFLRESHGKQGAETSGPSKVTIKRKSVTELRVPAAAGRAKMVNVEVRKKRTYVKRSAVETTATLDPDREEARRKLQEVHAERDAESAKLEKVENERQAEIDAEAKEQEEEQARLAAEETAEAERRDNEAAEEKAAAERERLESVEKALLEAVEKERLEAAEKTRQEQVARDAQKVKKSRQKGRAGAAHDTRYGRNELHVAAGKSGLRKSRRPARKTFDAPEQHGFSKPTAPVIKEINVPESITVAELSQKLATKAPEVIKVLMGMGMMVTVNQPIDQDTAILVVEELGHTANAAAGKDLEARLMDEYRAEIGEQSVRPPVVTVMGHVDHGKTSLLDHIRKTRVTEGEAGGITQHIGAYHVKTDKGVISFLDTPGHAAFTAMRARGAQATDIVILVVAADDGVMPQTEEAIKHARAAEVPIIVAINKIDRPEANVERAKQELSKHEVIAEDWGGEDIFVNVSAKTGEGIDDLLDAILLQAELLELEANPDARASGVVVESTLDKGRGPVATILVQNGTLKKGDMLLAGQEFGRVRAMFNELGEPIDAAGPSIPVVVLGLSGTPMSGEDVLVVSDEKHAKEAAEDRTVRIRDARLAKQQAAKLDNLFENMAQDTDRQVNLLIKADVQGSAEALKDAMSRLSNERVKVNVVLSGVGGITESDATFAQASNAIVIGFNVRADASARRIIQEAEIDLHYYSVIYDAIDEVKKAITGLLGTEVKEKILGLAEVKDVFRSSKLGAIAGCLVIEGVVRSDNPIRVLRDNVVIFEGELESLRRFKDEAKEVKSGVECGIGVKQYNDVKPGDQIECFERIEVAITLD